MPKAKSKSKTKSKTHGSLNLKQPKLRAANPTVCRTMGKFKLKMIIFDLDYTLWPFWVDTHVTPPFRIDKSGEIRDARNMHVTSYPDVPEMLQKLTDQGYILAAASRTGYVKEAKQLLKLFSWGKLLPYTEIYPGDKTAHMRSFQQKTGVQFQEMLFFDDEDRNIKDVSQLGVTSILASDGMNNAELARGLAAFTEKNDP